MATLLRRVPNLCRDTAHFSKQADARLQRALDDLEAFLIYEYFLVLSNLAASYLPTLPFYVTLHNATLPATSNGH